MLNKITAEEMSQVFSRALQHKLIAKQDTAVIFYDLSRLMARLTNLIDVFPKSALHAIAVKANPLTAILKKINALDVGLEVASFPELRLAEKAGFSPEKIVFDSPAKTHSELEYALKRGIYLNADSFQELERIAQLQARQLSNSVIGIRINPQVGTGHIESMSVGGEYSKFGVPLQQNRQKLIDAFIKYDWLKGVHLHIGSQGCAPQLLVKGIRTVLNLVNEINEGLQRSHQNRQVETIDIGGGLPVSYYQDETAITMQAYQQLIQVSCPELFEGNFKIITEFGRYIYGNVGWVASRVEYVKAAENMSTAVIHVGADLFLRECYNPNDWHHEISLVDNEGHLKRADEKYYAIAGPLCFGGDMLEKNLRLPSIEIGDYIFIHDTGANTLSLWSRHNSRQMPKIIGYYDNGTQFEILKEREDADKLWEFWS
ncbi:MAG: diaminopimelate decarboxylase [Candidatus Parabeggiatoa sp. nov. 1]|nr:MAG: diaminopimelate decarboxylase [Gammaproteobacteria bacterium]